MAEPKRTLPEYASPPVIETYLSVQFLLVKKITTRHFGRYFEYVKEHYPQLEIQHPIGQTVEEFGSGVGRVPRVEILTEPDFRCWFIDNSETRLIQVQRDRFILNWRKVKDDDVYPRYDKIKPEFQQEWQRFCQFLDRQELGNPEVNQCEITYINHIEVGDGWKSYGELNKIIACWRGTYSGDFLREPESVGLNAHYVLPENKGRLHITMEPAVRKKDAKEILQLTLTARGQPGSSRLEDILLWFDLGHEWIVRGFTDYTTEKMHKHWGREL